MKGGVLEERRRRHGTGSRNTPAVDSVFGRWEAKGGVKKAKSIWKAARRTAQFEHYARKIRGRTNLVRRGKAINQKTKDRSPNKRIQIKSSGTQQDAPESKLL